MQTNKEQLHTARRQCESAEENVKTLERRADELINELDAARSNCSQLVQEKDMLQKSHDTVRIEKNALDKSRVEVNSMVRYIFFSRSIYVYLLSYAPITGTKAIYVCVYLCRWKI